MISDKVYIREIEKIMNNHNLQGRDAPAFMAIHKWLKCLEDRLNPVKGKKKNGN